MGFEESLCVDLQQIMYPGEHGGTLLKVAQENDVCSAVQCKSAELHCFASFAACFFPSSILSCASPSHVCSTVIAVILRTPIKRSQNSMYWVTYSKPGGGTV